MHPRLAAHGIQQVGCTTSRRGAWFGSDGRGSGSLGGIAGGSCVGRIVSNYRISLRLSLVSEHGGTILEGNVRCGIKSYKAAFLTLFSFLKNIMIIKMINVVTKCVYLCND